MKRKHAFSMLETLVVVAIIAAIVGISFMIRARDRAEWDKIKAPKRVMMIEFEYSKMGIDSPESARRFIASIIMQQRGIDTATVTDWSPEALSAMGVEVPEYTSPEALVIVGIPEPQTR